MNPKYKKALIIASTVVSIFLIYYFLLKDYCTLSMLQNHRDYLLRMVNTHYFATISIFCITYITFTAFALPEAGLFSILGGFLFGSLLGSTIVIVCATIGGILTFLATRYFLGDFIQKKYSVRLHAFNSMINKHGTLYILFIRLITIVPFFIVNLLAGITKLPLSTFIWTTALGIIPGTYAYALIGEQFKTIGSECLSISPRLIIMAVVLICLAGIGFIITLRTKQK